MCAISLGESNKQSINQAKAGFKKLSVQNLFPKHDSFQKRLELTQKRPLRCIQILFIDFEN